MKTELVSTLLLMLLTAQTLAWSKCPMGRCKSCNHKGCVKCDNFWSDWNYDCNLPVITNTATNCLHQHPTLQKKCLRCRNGYFVNAAMECEIINSSDCIDGVFIQNKFKCTSCRNGKSASYTGDCTDSVPNNITMHCTATNMTYNAQGVMYECAQCDYGYSLDQDNNCKVSCAEGCLKCDARHVCIECDFYRGWWSNSPHNCTKQGFDYYNPIYGASVVLKSFALVLTFALSLALN